MLPGLVLLVGAAFVAGALSKLPEHGQLGAALFNVWRYGPLLLALAGAVQMLAASYRLWQWQRGGGYECQRCGGALGSLQMRGGYRRCLGCGQRHYE